MILLENRRARFDYEILQTFEAGMMLEGWEVKSLRSKSGNMKAAWVKFVKDGAYLENCSIPRWRFSILDQNKLRSKKLLLQKKEIAKLEQKSKEKGLTIIPTKIFTKGKHIKCEIAIVKGRKKYEKRQVIKDRDAKRTVEKMMRQS